MKSKLIISGIVVGMLFIESVFSANAGSISFSTSYGSASGKSSTYTWSQPSTPKYRRVQASTTNTLAAPKIAASVTAYKFY